MADDFLKTIEQARTIMKLMNLGSTAGGSMGGPATAGSAAGGPPSGGPAAFSAAASPPKPDPPPAPPEPSQPVPDADLKILSAVIPFVPGRNRKSLFMALKVMEILRFNERFGGPVTIAENEEKPFRPEELVSAVSPYITAADRERLHILVKAAEIDKLMNALKESATNGQKNTR